MIQGPVPSPNGIMHRFKVVSSQDLNVDPWTTFFSSLLMEFGCAMLILQCWIAQGMEAVETIL